MGAARPLFGFLGLALLAAGVVLQFFVILSGTSTGTPTDLSYFLQVSTDGVSGARNPSRWTYWGICGADGSRNVDCGALVPAHPFDPPRNFGTDSGLPEGFIGTRKFFLLSRFAWVFYLMALVFAAFALLTGVLALCTRLGAYISGFNAMVALFFQTLAAALMTAWSVEGRNIFRANNQEASLGRYAYGFTWGAVAAFMLSTVLFCIGGSVGGRDSSSHSSRFGRKRSTRSRGSFIDSESQRRVKADYA
ncbi:SUR7/PalI family-domain-containing protein [Elsinoe ampelina]|uniref:SUR7/PalI family-domain-containing protein n=1 Tax=Elsinoe ampelina TaxID=302913 RepID=A0A6A6GI03_9PEZI|nr:SUR7/PalI family-domain-containing protein [Elsinoe ampelina]